MKKITILGSTGSIGTQALEVVKKCGFKVIGLSANTNISLLAKQAREFDVKYVCIQDVSLVCDLKNMLGDSDDIEVFSGEDGLCKLASLDESDIVLNSVVGIVGLKPTLAAIEVGKDIALANKETLVAGGELVISAAKRKNVSIFPVDSEHSAIFQCLQACPNHNYLKKILLTASGGPFFGKNKEELKGVTLNDALKHPNWNMGSKITVDSSTLMNKGLELIEAMWLFGVSSDDIEIVVHSESVVHSLIQLKDNSVLAQLGVPDMKIPIQYALTYPKRQECDVKELSLTDYGTLSFKKPDYETFRCLSTCIEAAKIGGTMPATVNGANEEAVSLYIDGHISFLDIGMLVEKSLTLPYKKSDLSLDDILNADRAARDFVCNEVKKII